MSVSRPPPHDPARDTGSPVARFGTLAGIVTASAMVCALPAVMRLAPSLPAGLTPWHMWLALASAALLPMGAAVFILGRAREGTRAFAGPGAAPVAFGVSMWLVIVGVALTVLGAVLRATTHHHGLAGVTYALGGLALALVSAVVCARIVGTIQAASAGVRRALTLSLSVLLGLSVVLVAFGCARASARDAASSAELGTVVDVLAFLLAAVFGARRAQVVRRLLALVGPPAVVVVVAVGVPALRSGPVREIVREKAPAFDVAAELWSAGR
jgi:hypothetical protein